MKPRNSHRTRFVVRVVPHRSQRYETVGDWVPGSPVEIRVSKMRDERYVFLVALHELVEFELCRMHGVRDPDVVRFDRDFEAERACGLHSACEEPGDDRRAPYRKEHAFATMIERLVAQKLGVRWSAYEETILKLDARKKIPLTQVAVRNRVAGAGRV
jgi:hypothetical protein